MSKCQGKNCNSSDGIGHSVDCMFEHFMSYTDGEQHDIYTQELIEQAFRDGFSAGKSELVRKDFVVPVFSAMGMDEPKLPTSEDDI